jgi:nitroimidazol reductase NimA-like FMN-containing flavoprotein (pyridoxamine 5'-phosphate oxidase superfamily)
MNTAKAELDPRFSDPAAVATEWDEARRVLEAAELFWICTVRADGRPHVTPLVAVWLDGAIHFTTGDGEQKRVNLRGNAHVILMTGCNRWDDGLDVVVEGDAVRQTDQGMLERLAAAWATKWTGQWQWEVRDGCFHDPPAGEALVFSVRPTKILAFAKGTFGATRYRFAPDQEGPRASGVSAPGAGD